MLYTCLQLSTSTSEFPFLVFLTVFVVALVEITFSMRKGENLGWQISFKDSTTMNLGKSVASFDESDSDRFRLVFYLKTPQYIFAALCSTIHYATCVGNVPRGKPICLVWDGDTWPVYSSYWLVFEPLPISGSQHWSNSYSINASDPQSPTYSS